MASEDKVNYNPRIFVDAALKTLSAKNQDDDDYLYDADPNCKHEIEGQFGGGVKCKNCRGWFCY
jgi:hypothetical protein